MTVTGNLQTAKVVLSGAEYKTEHLVLLALLNSKTKLPLLPGEYTLSFNLFKQN